MEAPVLRYLTGHTSPGKLRRAVWRALREARVMARENRFNNAVHAKFTPGRIKDVVTDMDRLGTDRVIGLLREIPALNFIGVKAEDADDIAGEYLPGLGTLYWVVDVWDGSKLHQNGNHKGITGAVALILEHDDSTYEVLLAIVINLGDGDIFGTDAWWDGVYVVSDGDEELFSLTGPPIEQGLGGAYFLCRDGALHYDGAVGAMLQTPKKGGLAARTPTYLGSIPESMQLIATGIATCLVLAPREDTTKLWDHAPLVALLMAMGLVPVQVADDGTLITEGVEPLLMDGCPPRTRPTIWVPSVFLGDLAAFMAAYARAHSQDRMADEPCA